MLVDAAGGRDSGDVSVVRLCLNVDGLLLAVKASRSGWLDLIVYEYTGVRCKNCSCLVRGGDLVADLEGVGKVQSSWCAERSGNESNRPE